MLEDIKLRMSIKTAILRGLLEKKHLDVTFYFKVSIFFYCFAFLLTFFEG